MIPIAPILLFLVGAVLLTFLAWYAGKHAQPRESKEIEKLKSSERARIVRMAEMRAAYKLAKEELGEEPTVDQIFLTRDSLRKDDNGTT
jgi:hypothetical protein